MHSIILKIKSLFEGEGMTKAESATKDFGRTAGRMLGPINSLENALGKVGGTAGKVAQGAASMVRSLAAMGPMGAVFTALQIGIKAASDKIVKHFQDMADAAKAMGDVVRDKLKNQINKILGQTESSLKTVGVETDSDTKKMKNLADAVNKVNTALGKREDAAAAAAAAKLEFEKMQSLMGIENENVRKVTEAEWDYKIALEAGKATLESRARAEEEAATKVNQAQAASDAAVTNLNNARAALAKAEEDVARFEELAVNGTAEINEGLNRAKKTHEEAQKLVAKREEELQSADTNLKTATIDLETERKKTQTAEIQNRQAVEEAAQNRRDANREAAENQAKEREAANQAKALADAKAQRDAAQKAAEDALTSASTDLEVAKSKLREAEERQAQWEVEKRTVDQNQFTKLQAQGQEALLAQVEKRNSDKALTEGQKKVLEEYKRWKNLMQDKNPYDEMVMKFKQQVNIETERLEQEQSVANANLEKIDASIKGIKAGTYDYSTTDSSSTTDYSTTDNSVSTSNSNNKTYTDNTSTNSNNVTYNSGGGADYAATLAAIASSLATIQANVTSVSASINTLATTLEKCLTLK